MNLPRIIDTQIRDVEFGKNVTVVQPANLYGFKIGKIHLSAPLLKYKKMS
jgi:hypothetical protein